MNTKIMRIIHIGQQMYIDYQKVRCLVFRLVFRFS